jgi:hypothetical protein
MRQQECRGTRPDIGVGRDFVVKHLVRNVVCIDLCSLLLQAIGDLEFQLHNEIGILLQDLDDLIRREG